QSRRDRDQRESGKEDKEALQGVSFVGCDDAETVEQGGFRTVEGIRPGPSIRRQIVKQCCRTVRAEGGSAIVDFRILGPFEAWRDGARLPLGGLRQRALLAYLVIHRGESVSAERLLDELWSTSSPAGGAKAVQVYVSRLRSVLGPGVI